ncbi:MAG: Uncharacterized protein LiPW30_763 [Parcubacteria group bacterium LiPW_30]|nr:MAG: Uncharacterized protein LiPW30_763 [Parcubacteria group bacterium LiPW_30]
MEQTTLSEVQERFNSDFNFISVQLLEKAYPDGKLMEYIIYPDGYDWGNEEEPLYPMWSTLFEAKDEFLSDKLKKYKNEMAEVGIYLMEIEETNAMMFICGCGYDFYQAHWVPLYRDILKWVK